MIHAVIIICKLISATPECLIISDSWGPYQTKEKCETRTKQMYKDAKNILSISKYELGSSKCLTDEEHEKFVIKYFKFALFEKLGKQKKIKA